MNFKRFSIAVCAVAVSAAAAWAGDVPAPSRDVQLAQSIKERDLPDLPAVDADRAPPRATRSGPPPPPPVPPAPRVTSRTAPPPAADDESGPPPREVPPPPSTTARTTPLPPPPPPPTRLYEPERRAQPAPPPAIAAPERRAAPSVYDDGPPPSRRAGPPPRLADPPPSRVDAPRRPPAKRSTFAANCTQQCHLSCEASFEACNGDSSPAKPACVKKLESCRVERCSCRFD